MKSIVEALSYLHEQGIYHRDMKPGNLNLAYIFRQHTLQAASQGKLRSKGHRLWVECQEDLFDEPVAG
jgi:hypothetical protein